MANRVQVRGCCCGIPFGCGLLVLAGGVVAVWQYAMTPISSLLALFAR